MRSYIKTPEAVRPISPWNFVGNLFSAYGFPRDLPGGSMIGIGELGGGWVPSDVSTFFQLNGLVEPGIIDVSVNGAGNNADVTDPASGEVALDIQLAAAAYTYCTGEIASLRIYWAPNAAGSIAAATKMAADDGCDVMSWSWGEDEALTGKEACVEMDAVVAEAAANGMVVTAAAGDNDSSDGGNTPANVDSPASCPHVIACGGTRKEHAIGVETVWNNNPGKTDGEGTGGGLSTVFAIPSW